MTATQPLVIEHREPDLGPYDTDDPGWCVSRTALLDYLATRPDLPAICVEAIVAYAYTLCRVDQETVLPGGEVEHTGPLQEWLQLEDFEVDRFLYRVEAWFRRIAERLPRLTGDWESWTAGGFRHVRRDEDADETTCWTVHDVGASQPLSTWSLQVERGGDRDRHCMTFAVANDITGSTHPRDGAGGREQQALTRTFRAFRQRLGRLLGLLQHVQSLRLRSTQEYRDWCQVHGFEPELHKAVRQRRAELDALSRTGSAGGDRAWFDGAVCRIHDGQARDTDLRTEYLRRIAGAFAGGLAGGARAAYRDLLLHVERHASLLGLEPAVGRLGPQPGNTYIEGMAELARRHRDWLRPLDEWAPRVQDPRQQFGELARHLLVRYDVPAFMDAAWFRGRSAMAQRQQTWFQHLAAGHNIRTADVPVALSKRMAHQFAQAPERYTIEDALRWAQIVGQGGTEELAEAVGATPLGSSFENESFWSTVITFLVRNSMLDPDWVGPIVDYIQHRKFEPREIAHPGGQVEIADPPEPQFSMKSRSVPKLLDQIEAWHTQLAREERATFGGRWSSTSSVASTATGQWERSPVLEFQCEEEDLFRGGTLRWSIRQLLTLRELKSEGQALHHCAASYARGCRAGKTSVWSLQVTDGRDETLRVVTIAVDPRSRAVTQVRGRFNLTPASSRKGKRGIDETYSWYLRRAGDVLRTWARREKLGQKGGDLYDWTRLG